MYRGAYNIIFRKIMALGAYALIGVLILRFGSQGYAAGAVTSAKPSAVAQPTKAPAQTTGSAAVVSKDGGAVSSAAKTAAAVAAAIPAPPPMAGVQKIAGADIAKLPKLGNTSKADPKSFTQQLEDFEKAKAAASKDKNKDAKKPLPKKVRVHTVDVQILVWDSKASGAEVSTHNIARKLSGDASNYLVKDAAFMQDTTNKFACLMRINFQDQIPENWYLESEMSVGFGTTYERAYASAMQKASAKVEAISDNADWVGIDSSLKSSMENGVVPYNIMFASAGKELYCKLFFKYLKKRS